MFELGLITQLVFEGPGFGFPKAWYGGQLTFCARVAGIKSFSPICATLGEWAFW